MLILKNLLLKTLFSVLLIISITLGNIFSLMGYLPTIPGTENNQISQLFSTQQAEAMQGQCCGSPPGPGYTASFSIDQSQQQELRFSVDYGTSSYITDIIITSPATWDQDILDFEQEIYSGTLVNGVEVLTSAINQLTINISNISRSMGGEPYPIISAYAEHRQNGAGGDRNLVNLLPTMFGGGTGEVGTGLGSCYNNGAIMSTGSIENFCCSAYNDCIDFADSYGISYIPELIVCGTGTVACIDNGSSELIIDKSSDIHSGFDYQIITYTITLFNSGTITKTGIVIQDIFANGFVYSGTISLSQGTIDASSSGLIRDVGDLGGNQTGIFVYQGYYTYTGSKENTAFISGCLSISCTDTELVDIEQGIPHIENNKTYIGETLSGFIHYGMTGIYSITLTNIGSGFAQGVKFIDDIPSQFVVTSWNSSNGFLNQGNTGYISGQFDMIPGEEVTINIFGQWIFSTGGTIANNSIIISTGLCDPDCISTVEIDLYNSGLLIHKAVNLTTGYTNSSTIIYTITITNPSLYTMSGILVDDQLPEGFTGVADPSQGTYNTSAGLRYVGGLSANGFATLVISGTFMSTGPKLNLAMISSGFKIIGGEQVGNICIGSDCYYQVLSNIYSNGICNTAIANNYYTGNLPEIQTLCSEGILSGPLLMNSGIQLFWTWDCLSTLSGSSETGCNIEINYCGDNTSQLSGSMTGANEQCDGNSGCNSICSRQSANCSEVDFRLSPSSGIVPFVANALFTIPTGYILSGSIISWGSGQGSSSTIYSGISHLYTVQGVFSPEITLQHLGGGSDLICTGYVEGFDCGNFVPDIISSTSQLTCNTGSITLTGIITGGYQSGYWILPGGGAISGNSITINQSGNYTFYANSGYCSGNKSIVIEGNTTAIITGNFSLINNPPLSCGGTGSIIVSGINLSGYEFSINGGASRQTNSEFSVNAGTYTLIIRKSNDYSCNPISFTTSLSDPSAPVVSISQNGPLSCGTGTVTLTASGATSYLWSNGSTSSSINVSSSGLYSVTGITAGCSATDTELVTGNTTAIITGNFSLINNPPLSCGGTGSIIVSGINLSGYEFSINGGASRQTNSGFSVNAGTYTLIIRKSNDYSCNPISLTTSLSDPSAPVVSISQNGPLSCGTGTVTLTASGATSYLWSNGSTSSSINVSSSGLYSVTGITAGCSATDTELVTGNTTAIITGNFSLINNPPLSCGGTGSIIVSGINLSGYEFSINGGASRQTNSEFSVNAGTYTLIIRKSNDYSCNPISFTTSLSDPSAPVVSISQNGPLSCGTGTVTLTASGATSYLWSNGSTSSSINVSSSGLYSVTGITAGCSATDTELVTGNTTAIITGNFSLINNPPLSCGGTGSIIVSGINLSGYEFSINGGASRQTNSGFSVNAGTYTLIIRKSNDYSCNPISLTTSLSDPSAPVVSISQNGPLSCGTGTVTLTASGATSYLWSNGSTSSSINVSSSGLYSVTGITAGCSATDTELVTGNTTAIITGNFSLINNPPLSCGGTGSIIVSGINLSGYEFSINGGASRQTNSGFSVNAGTYTLIIRKSNDYSCNPISLTTSLSDPSAPVVSISQNGPLSCGTGTVTLTASGATSYLWSNGSTSSSINVSSSGLYSVTGITAGCSATDTELVTGDDLCSLKIIKTSSKTVAELGETTSYNITVTNDNLTAVTNIDVSDILPIEFSYLNHATTLGTATETFNTINRIIPNLSAGQSATLTVSGIWLQTGTHNNEAIIDLTDCVGATCKDDIDVLVQSKGLLITKGGSSGGAVGVTMNYNVAITNTSIHTATGVIMEEVFPVGFIGTVISGYQGSFDYTNKIWSVGTIAPGATVTISFEGYVNDPGTYINNAIITSGFKIINSTLSSEGLCENNDCDDDHEIIISPICEPSQSFINSPAMRIYLFADKTSVVAGDNITYHIYAFNIGETNGNYNGNLSFGNTVIYGGNPITNLPVSFNVAKGSVEKQSFTIQVGASAPIANLNGAHYNESTVSIGSNIYRDTHYINTFANTALAGLGTYVNFGVIVINIGGTLNSIVYDQFPSVYDGIFTSNGGIYNPEVGVRDGISLGDSDYASLFSEGYFITGSNANNTATLEAGGSSTATVNLNGSSCNGGGNTIPGDQTIPGFTGIDLSIVKTGSISNFSGNYSLLQYTLYYANSGTNTISDVYITDTIPNNFNISTVSDTEGNLISYTTIGQTIIFGPRSLGQYQTGVINISGYFSGSFISGEVLINHSDIYRYNGSITGGELTYSNNQSSRTVTKFGVCGDGQVEGSEQCDGQEDCNTESCLWLSGGCSNFNPTIITNYSQLTCSTGSITLSASSGDMYLRSGGQNTQDITVNESGNYNVTVRSGSCSGYASIIISGNSTIIETGNFSIITGTTTSCGGSGIIMVSGTNLSDYLYSLNGGNYGSSPEFHVTAGNYIIYIQKRNDTTCNPIVLQVSILDPNPPQITITQSGSFTCEQTGITLIASGASTYIRSNGQTSNSIVVYNTGIYSVTGSESNCSQFSEILVTGNELYGNITGLSIDQYPGEPEYELGSFGTYTIIVRNTGGQTISGIYISDTFPNEFLISGYSTDSNFGSIGSSLANNHFTSLYFDLPNSGLVIIVFTGQWIATGNSLYNTASINGFDIGATCDDTIISSSRVSVNYNMSGSIQCTGGLILTGGICQVPGICSNIYNNNTVTSLMYNTEGLCNSGIAHTFSSNNNSDGSTSYSWICNNNGINSEICHASTPPDSCTYPGCSDFYDLSINKSITSTGPYNIGSIVNYRIEFLNSGNSTVVDAIMEDIIAEGQILTGSISYDSDLDIGGFTSNNQVLTWQIVSLSPNQRGWVEFSVVIDSLTGSYFSKTTIYNGSEVTRQEAIPPFEGICETGHNPISGDYAVFGTNNTDCEELSLGMIGCDSGYTFNSNTNQCVPYLLSIHKQGPSQETYIIDQDILYLIHITNNGPQSATGIIIQDYLPSGFALNYSVMNSLYVDNPIQPSVNGSVISRNIPSISSGQIITLFVFGSFTQSHGVGSGINTAVITSGYCINCTGIDIKNVDICGPEGYLLSINKTSSRGDNASGTVQSPISYTITVTNTGYQPANNVSISDIVPTGFSGTATTSTGSFTLAGGIWNLSLGIGQSATLTLNGYYLSSGVKTNTATITSGVCLPGSCSSTVTNIITDVPYNLIINKSIINSNVLATTGTALINDNLTYTVTITNQGPQTASGIVVSDLMPSGFVLNSFIPYQLSTGTFNTNTMTWNQINLGVGQSATLQLLGQYITDGIKTNYAVIMSGLAFNKTGVASINVLPCTNGMTCIHTGVCNTGYHAQVYTGTPTIDTGLLCIGGTTTGLIKTDTGWTWNCLGMGGGGNTNGCYLTINSGNSNTGTTGTNCGTTGQVICTTGNVCMTGLVNQGGVCISTCSSGYNLSETVCIACDNSGQVACNNGSGCIAELVSSGGVCMMAGTTGTNCGTIGQVICTTGNACMTGLVNQGGVCISTCSSGYNLSGVNCVTCGNSGQVACNSVSGCASGLVNSGGICIMTGSTGANCGTTGQVICTTGNACMTGLVNSGGVCMMAGSTGTNNTGASYLSGLRINKTVSRLYALPGETVTWTISYGVYGTGIYEGIKVDDVLPVGGEFVSTSLITGYSYTGGVLSYNVGTLTGVYTGSFTLLMKIGTGVLAGTQLVNTVSGSASGWNTVIGTAMVNISEPIHNVPTLGGGGTYEPVPLPTPPTREVPMPEIITTIVKKTKMLIVAVENEMPDYVNEVKEYIPFYTQPTEAIKKNLLEMPQTGVLGWIEWFKKLISKAL